MNTNVFALVPAKIRIGIYLTLASVALVLAALQAADVDSLWGLPTVKALAALGILAAPFGITAASNITTDAGDTGPGMAAGHDANPEVDEVGAATRDAAVWMVLALLGLLLAVMFVPPFLG